MRSIDGEVWLILRRSLPLPLWKNREVFHSFHRVFNRLCEKVQKQTRKSKISLEKLRGKPGGKRGKVPTLRKAC